MIVIPATAGIPACRQAGTNSGFRIKSGMTEKIMTKLFKNPVFLRRAFIAMSAGFFALVLFFIFVPVSHAWNIEPIYKVLRPPFDPGSNGETVANIWQQMMNLVDSVILIVLIAVAFMNILRVQLDSYAVKKFLPTFIMAIILANFSFLLARVIVDLGNMAISLFLYGNTANGITGAFDSLIGPGSGPTAPGAAGDSNYFGVISVYIVKQIMVIVGAVFIFILSFVFIVRNYLLYFLVAIAPIACMAIMLPMTKKYFQMWWSNFTKWVFMPVVAVFWLKIASVFMASVKAGGSWILPYALAVVCFYMAITSPFKIGGAVITGWNKFGKEAWGKTGGKVTGYGKKLAMEEYDVRKAAVANKLANTKMVPGLTKNKEGKYEFRKLSPRESAALRRQRLAGPRMVTEKQTKDANYAAMKYYLDQGKMHPDILKRYASAMRTEAQGEANTTYDVTPSSQLLKNMDENGLSPMGRLQLGGEKFSKPDDVKQHFGSIRAYQKMMTNGRYRAQIDAEFRTAEMGKRLGYDHTDDLAVEKAKLLFSQIDVGGYDKKRIKQLATLDKDGNVTGFNHDQFEDQAKINIAKKLEAKKKTPTTQEIDKENAERLRAAVFAPPAEESETGAPAPIPGASEAGEAGQVNFDSFNDVADRLQEVLAQSGGNAGGVNSDSVAAAAAKAQPTEGGMAASILTHLNVNARVTDIDPAVRAELEQSSFNVSKRVQKIQQGLTEHNAPVLEKIAGILGDSANPIGAGEISRSSQIIERADQGLKLALSANPTDISEATKIAKELSPEIEPTLNVTPQTDTARIRATILDALNRNKLAAQAIVDHEGKSLSEIQSSFNLNVKAHATTQLHLETLVDHLNTKGGDLEKLIQSAANRVVLSDPRMDDFAASHGKEVANQLSEQIVSQTKETLSGELQTRLVGQTGLTATDRTRIIADLTSQINRQTGKAIEEWKPKT